MQQTILFIDGENFTHKIEQILYKDKLHKDKIEIYNINLNVLFKNKLKHLKISKKIFYNARLHDNKDTPEKSTELIKSQRKLRNTLTKQGYEFKISGNVRAQKVDGKTLFREKGVDVKIAIDLVTLACDKKLDTAIICSSDSDLQPAISELKKRNVYVVYLGFSTDPNKGLMYTSNKTILLKNNEVLKSFEN